MQNFKIKSCAGKAETKDEMACKGFTLIELMIVIAIIGILASIAIPNFIGYRKKARIAGAAADIKNFEKEFIAYALDEGEFPDDSHIVLPDLPRMADFIDPGVWGKTTALGGTYNWEGPDGYPYAGIALFEATAPQRDLELLDAMLDDGDLSQGKFRQTPNDRYTYIIEE
jgi:prepilin-type N-terminal cleavage/methylation domain-containing protein